MVGFAKLLSAGADYLSKTVNVIAERKFKDGVEAFCDGFTPQHLAYLAESDIPIGDIISLGGFNVQPTKRSNLPGIDQALDHLYSLSDERLIELIAEVKPEHAEVLRLFPQNTTRILAFLKGMVLPDQ